MPWNRACLLLAAVLLAASGGAATAQQPSGMLALPGSTVLARPIDLDFEKTSLDNVLKYIDEVCPDLSIVIDPAVSAAGIDLSTRVVDLKVRQVPVQAVLDLLLCDDLAYRSPPGYVLVTTRERAFGNVVAVMYPVDGLIQRLSADPAYGADAGTDPVAASAASAERERMAALDLVDVLQRLVNHRLDQGAAAWADGGGTAAIDYVNGALAVRQTTAGHRRLAEALATIAKAFDLAVATQDLSVPQTVQPVVALPEPKAVAETRRRLEEPLSVDFLRTSLENVLKYIGEVQRGLYIVVDPALASAGIDLDARVVDFKCNRLPVRTVLPLVLGSDMGFAAREGFVLVTTRELSHARPALKAYPVADLARAVAKETSVRAWLAESERMVVEQSDLVDIIRRLVNNRADPLVAAWTDERGRAAVEPLGGALLITQTERGHARALHVLNALRTVAVADPAKTVAPVPVSPEHEAVEPTWQRLAQPIDAEFDRTPLDAALAQLARRRPDLNLVIDPAVAASGIDLSTRTATLRLQQLPTASVLDLLLAFDLGYCVEAGCVCVTLREKAHSDLPAAVYPVADVIKALRGTAVWRGWQNLVDAIQRCVNQYADPHVAAWSDEGGAAAIEYFGGTLIVTQTRRGHANLAALLGALRAALIWQQAREAGALQPAQKAFPIPDPETEAAARRLETPVDVSLYGLTLEQTIRTLSARQSGLNLVLDPCVRAAGIDPAAYRVTVQLHPSTVGELLRQILPASMGLCARPGYVLVTTREVTCERLPLALYPAADLLDGELRRRGKDLAEVMASDFDVVFDDLAAGIRRAVNAQSDPHVAPWSDEGGPAMLDELGDVLLISQTPRGHARVLAYLNALRAGW